MKVGDKVLFVAEGLSLVLKSGIVYEILDVDDNLIEVVKGNWYDKDLFRKATKLEKALK